MQLAIQHPVATAVKGGSTLYRCFLLFAVLMVAVVIGRQADQRATPLVYCAIAFAVGKTIFCAWAFFIESRYLIPAIPILEIALVCGAFSLLQRGDT